MRIYDFERSVRKPKTEAIAKNELAENVMNDAGQTDAGKAKEEVAGGEPDATPTSKKTKKKNKEG